MSGKLSWKDVLINRLIKGGFSKEESHSVYLVEMEARKFFDFDGIVPSSLMLQNIEQDKKEMQYFWESNSVDALCPFCGTLSTRPSSDYYTKLIQDIPYNNKAVYHAVRFNRYFCENSECKYEEFIERFSHFSEEKARKTVRFKKYCIERSLGCGCNHAEYELRMEGAVISNDTLGRYLKSEAAAKIEDNITRDDVKVLAVDDINLRKGDKKSGCTVLLDEETHKVLIIIKGTTKEMTKRALEMFPSAQFFSRDRATAYSSAGAECGKIQIADRFHLIKNAQEAIQNALMASIPATIFVRDGDGWVQTTPEDSVNSTSYFYVPDERAEEYIKLAGLTPAKARKYRNTLKLLELADKGLKTADIAKEMDVPYKDVQALRRSAASTLRYVEDRIKKNIDAQNNAIENREERQGSHTPKTVGGPNVRPASETIVEPYRETVMAMVKSGGNHRTIYPVIQEMGYTGSSNAIYQYILKLRREVPDQLNRKLTEMPPEMTLESYPRDKIYSAILKEASNSRPGNAENSEQDTKSEATKKTPKANNSPFSTKVTELILGPEKEIPEEKEKPKKKPTLP
ncbi:transposase [Desulfitibacter alkalitolerans]|uniref:transposase n=1 Tax=Desulfitibacter alkalitolerans TaxID=264641 RepID=UPI0004879E3F|nr:transposase [Desulfitibacter alkalitolerans]